ncbi:MAG TPA: RNA polymerase sigma factor [Ktedonobacteraceae bacterium]|nr:RNA polymerase sigma factor [Ktedonobacteraceae bacterium]
MIIELCWNQVQKGSTHFIQERDVERTREETETVYERHLLKRLKEGDEAAFVQLVEQYHKFLLWLARKYVRSQSSAEEVVQETWMGVLQRLPFFEERSSLKTWIIRILINQACMCARREQHLVPFSSLEAGTEEADGSVTEPVCLQEAEQAVSGAWLSLTADQHAIPEANLLAAETHTHVAEAIEALPANQRAVMVLCAIEGRRPEEVCTRLGISAANQRVLLHRAHAKVRRALEKYFDEP